MIRFLRNTSILTRLLFWFALVGLVPLLLIVLLITNLSQDALRNEVENNLNTTADSKALQIESYMLERTQDVNALALTPSVINGARDLETALIDNDFETYSEIESSINPLLSLIAEQAGYTDLMLFSPNNRFLYSVNPNRTGLNISGRLGRLLTRSRTLLQAQVSDFTFELGVGRPTLYVGAPILDNNVVVGIVVIELDNQALYDVINERTGLGNTGETLVGFIRNDELVYTAPTFFNNEATFDPITSDVAEAMAEAIQGIQGTGLTTDYRDEEVIAVWRYLPSLRWGMLVKIDTNEAFEPIETERNFVLVVFLFTLATVLIVAFLLASSLSRPLRDLVQATQSVATGVYENKITTRASGEIATLVEAFDTLIANTISQRTTELEGIAEQERENSRLKDEFIAVMSHELRTPLNSIIGFLGIVQKKADLDEKNYHRITRARNNSERLLALINDILDISRIESGRLEIFAKPLEIRPFFNDIKAQMQSLADEKELSLTLEIDDQLPEQVITDKELLTKIMINLLGNAFKFTEEGGVTVKTHLLDPSTWQISVRDTGIGIPVHMQEVIFERFRQVDSSATRAHGGTGLGLSIVNSLSRELGGSINLESTPNEGSTFTITLPLESETILEKPESTLLAT